MRAVVVGLGAMGLPAARVLAERGHNVVGIDRHRIGAPAGSSSGETRIFRLSHTDRPMVRLALAALQAWRELERRTGEELLLVRGLLERGEPALDTARALAAEGVPYRELAERDVAALFPELRPRPELPAIVQDDAGTLLATRTLAVESRLARAAGAEISQGERALAVEPRGGSVRVTTDRRSLEADVALLCAGPWAAELLGPLGLAPPLRPSPVQVTYFACSDEVLGRPCMVDWLPAAEAVYGLPTPGKGYKLGFLDWRGEWDPDADESPVNPEEERRLAAQVAREMPGLGGPAGSECCPVTLTADGKFVLDRQGDVVVATGCSGQAFKFAPVLGEILADLAEDRPRPPDLELFRLGRPGLDRPFPSALELVLSSETVRPAD